MTYQYVSLAYEQIIAGSPKLFVKTMLIQIGPLVCTTKVKETRPIGTGTVGTCLDILMFFFTGFQKV